MSDPSKKNVFWGKVLHKEQRDEGGLTGYPDSGYLNDVVSTCRSLGVSCDSEETASDLVDKNNFLRVIPPENEGDEPIWKFKLNILTSNE